MAGGDSVQLIKERLSIVEVISPYVELHRAGKSFKGKSPFTNEKTPSFYVSPDRGMYYCFSSNQGGDIFTFVQTMEGVDFKGALKILAERAGVELVPEDPKKRTERDRQYALIEDATQFFFKARESTPVAEEYIAARGVSGKSIHTWRIGYAPDEWRALKEHLAEKGYTNREMLHAGLIKEADGGKEPYDVFRDRIMFPIFDSSGRVVAFSGRTMKKDDKTPKYVNSPETELYQKSDILFGYDKAKQGIRQFDFSLIVEGQFDLVLTHQVGYHNAVAVSGTALTQNHVALLERLSDKVVLALDADRAGIAAVKRAATMMLRKGMDVKVAALPDGKDPADIVRDDQKALKHIIGTSVHVIEFLLVILKRDSRDERSYKLRVREEIVPLLAQMPSRLDAEHFEGVVAEVAHTTRDAIHYEVERLLENADHTKVNAAPKEATVPKPAYAKEDFTNYLFAVARFLRSFDEQQHIVKNIESKLLDMYGQQYDEVFASRTPEELNKEITELELEWPEFPGKMFFGEIASKLSHHYRRLIDAQIEPLKKRQRELELEKQSDSDEYIQVHTNIHELVERRKRIDITEEELLANPT